MRKIKIKSAPKKNDGGSTGLGKFIGANTHHRDFNKFSEDDFKVNKTISSVPREDSNIEAEGGEFTIVPGAGGIPESYKITGPSHEQGGVPLNLAANSFIFSDNKKGMKIKDKDILAEFGISVPSKGKVAGKTPAEIAKKYDINQYKEILLDPNTDKKAKETAELMIENYNKKLGKLALVQESMKGFPQGVPEMALPYLMSINVTPEQFISGLQEEPVQTEFRNGGQNKKMAKRFPGLSIAEHGGEFSGKFWESILRNGGKAPAKSFYPDGGENKYNPVVKTVQGTDGVTYNIFKDGTYEPAEDNKEDNVATSQKSTNKTEIPKEYRNNPRYDQSSSNYDENILKTGDYVKGLDGKWRKVTYVPERVEYKGDDIKTVFNNDAYVADAYAYLENIFQDDEVKEAFAQKAREALLNKEYYKGKSGKYSDQFSPEEIEAMTDDDLVNNFLRMQKRNYSLQAYGFDPKDFTDANGNLKSKSQIGEDKWSKYKQLGIGSLNDAFKITGVPITDKELEAGLLGVQQGAYLGYADLIDEKDSLSPSLKQKLNFFENPSDIRQGVSDEPLGGKTISPIDSKSMNLYTNTTAGELALIDKGSIKYEDVEIEPEKEKITKKPQEFVEHMPRDEWWAQDIGNIANLFGQRVGLKKYLPHSTPVDLADPDVLYFDPSRALAANAEQANIASDAITSFAGAQGTYRLSGVAGQAFKNAANTLADYEAKNVAVGNQYLDKVQQTNNKESLANAERTQRLYDQWTTANQQFDNAKRMTNRNLFEAWRQGLTNKKKTQALNSLYPQFETIPSIGGGLYYTGVERPFTNTGTSSNTGGTGYLQEFQDLKRQYPDASDSAIKQQLDVKYGMKDTPSISPDKNEMMNMYKGVFNINGAYPPGMYSF